MEMNDDYHQRAQFLIPLSMTCKAMRLRLRPWIWDLVEPSRRRHVMNLTMVETLRTDTSLAASVRYLRAFLAPQSELIHVLSRFMTMRSLWDLAAPTFIKCLESLPSLHTLEIGFVYYNPRAPILKNALKGVKLPQIKSLVLPQVAHILIKHCPNVESVDWVVGDTTVVSDEFLESLASIRHSKIERLAIPLVSYNNPSRKRSTALYDHRMRATTDSPQSQDFWPHVQDSQNSRSSTLIRTHTYTLLSHAARKP